MAQPLELALVDDDTLQAALAFVDEFYASQKRGTRPRKASVGATPMKVSESSGAVISSSNSAQRQEQVPRSSHDGETTVCGRRQSMGGARSRRKRVSRREELISLRAKVLALENQRDMLAQDTSSVHSNAESVKNSSLWKAIARRQGVSRCEAEAMNHSLRDVVHRQRKLLTAIETLAKKGKTDAACGAYNLPPPKERAQGIQVRMQTSPLERLALVDKLLATLGVMVLDTTAVLADPRFHPASPPTRPHRVVRLRTGMAPSVEMLDERIFPFEFNAVAEAMWHNTKNGHGLASTDIPHSMPTITNDTLIKSFEGEVVFADSSMDCSVVGVMRRVVGPGQVTFVASGIIFPQSEMPCGTSLKGIRIHQRTWHVIRPVSQLKGSGHDAVVSQFYKLSTPEVYVDGGLGDRDPRIKSLTKILLDTISFYPDFFFQHLERCLLDSLRVFD